MRIYILLRINLSDQGRRGNGAALKLLVQRRIEHKRKHLIKININIYFFIVRLVTVTVKNIVRNDTSRASPKGPTAVT